MAFSGSQQTGLKPTATPGQVYASFANKAEATFDYIDLTLFNRALALTVTDRDLGLELQNRNLNLTLGGRP